MKFALACLVTIASASAFAGKIQNIAVSSSGPVIVIDSVNYRICSTMPDRFQTAILLVALEAQRNQSHVKATTAKDIMKPALAQGQCINSIAISN